MMTTLYTTVGFLLTGLVILMGADDSLTKD